LLEAVRRAGAPIPVIFASTNKVYGDLADLDFASTDGYLPANAAIRAHGIGEQRPLDFHTPYGCSKGAADQYVLDYARSFGVPAAVLRMSCIYGERQMGTEDQGWVAHFLIRALEGRADHLYGDGHQVRDILEVGDAVDRLCDRPRVQPGGQRRDRTLRSHRAGLQSRRRRRRQRGQPAHASRAGWRASAGSTSSPARPAR
jgi:nucleoside-diphosphate-sugar epimerase